MSFGFHYFETVNQSLTLQHFSLEESPVVFGLLRSRSAACNIVIGLFFLLFSKHLTFISQYVFFGLIVILASLYSMKYGNPLKTVLNSVNK